MAFLFFSKENVDREKYGNSDKFNAFLLGRKAAYIFFSLHYMPFFHMSFGKTRHFANALFRMQSTYSTVKFYLFFFFYYMLYMCAIRACDAND